MSFLGSIFKGVPEALNTGLRGAAETVGEIANLRLRAQYLDELDGISEGQPPADRVPVEQVKDNSSIALSPVSIAALIGGLGALIVALVV